MHIFKNFIAKVIKKRLKLQLIVFYNLNAIG